MKANEVPEKLYLSKNIYSTFLYQVPDPDDDTAVEYIRKDAFIKKAAEYLMDYEFNDSPTIADRRKRVEEFKKAMKEEK